MSNTEHVTSICAARKSSGLYQQECAEIIGVSVPTFRNIEQDDGLMTINQIEALLPHLNKISVKIIRDRLEDIFLKYE